LLYTAEGVMNMKNLKWANDHSPIDNTEGAVPTSKFYTKAYLRHLFHVGELLAGQIATLHNLGFYLWLVTEARKRILDGTFSVWKAEMVKKIGQRM
jgi:queuine tRNA-ribosyltransferase